MRSRRNWLRLIGRSRTFGRSWLALALLVLLSTTWAGCSTVGTMLGMTKVESPPPPPPASSCGPDGNVDEWTGYRVAVQVAREQKKAGDPYQFAKGIEWIAAVLHSCFPESFATAFAPAPEPPESAAPATPDETPDATP